MDNSVETPVNNEIRLKMPSFILLSAIGAVASALVPVTGGVIALLLLIVAVAAFSVAAGFFSIFGVFACLLSFGVLLVIPGVGPVLAATSLLPGFLGLVIGLCAKHKKGCSSTVVASTVLLSVCCVLAGCAAVYAYKGSLTTDTITGSFADLNEYFTALVRKVYELSASQTGSEVTVTDEFISSAVRYSMLTIPGMVIAVCEVLSFIFVKATVLVCIIFGVEGGLPDSKWKLDLSLIAASIYVIAFTASLVTSLNESGNSFFFFSNLLLTLIPGLGFVGLRGIFGRVLKNRRSKLPLIIAVVTCVFLFRFLIAMFTVITEILGFIGAASVIFRKLPRPKIDPDK